MRCGLGRLKPFVACRPSWTLFRGRCENEKVVGIVNMGGRAIPSYGIML
jgi:hypothetical protein